MTALTDEQIQELVTELERVYAFPYPEGQQIHLDAAGCIEQLMSERDAETERAATLERLLDACTEDAVRYRLERNQLRDQLAQVIAAGDECTQGNIWSNERWDEATKGYRS